MDHNLATLQRHYRSTGEGFNPLVQALLRTGRTSLDDITLLSLLGHTQCTGYLNAYEDKFLEEPYHDDLIDWLNTAPKKYRYVLAKAIANLSLLSLNKLVVERPPDNSRWPTSFYTDRIIPAITFFIEFCDTQLKIRGAFSKGNFNQFRIQLEEAAIAPTSEIFTYVAAAVRHLLSMAVTDSPPLRLNYWRSRYIGHAFRNRTARYYAQIENLNALTKEAGPSDVKLFGSDYRFVKADVFLLNAGLTRLLFVESYPQINQLTAWSPWVSEADKQEYVKTMCDNHIVFRKKLLQLVTPTLLPAELGDHHETM